jgi:hypothetical protein
LTIFITYAIINLPKKGDGIMNVVNDEFILELEKDYEYGRSHIREL